MYNVINCKISININKLFEKNVKIFIASILFQCYTHHIEVILWEGFRMIINTNGIYYLEPVGVSHTWFWGMDYTSGDLYEAEELYRHGHPVKKNRCIFVHYPDGQVIEPILVHEGQYLGKPTIYRGDKIYQLLVDFANNEIIIMCFNPDDILHGGEVEEVEKMPLSITEDCYNLILYTQPLILTRQSNNHFQIIWAETKGQMNVDFPIGKCESFAYMHDDRLFFRSWWEKEETDYEYHEEVIVRNLKGEITEKKDGGLFEIYPGEYWLLR